MQRVFIITGANRGLGKAFVDILIKNTDNFIISISRTESEEQKTYTASNYYFLKTDLTENRTNSNISVLKDLIADEAIFFINNASLIEPIIPIEYLNEDAIDRTISVNIKSAILITKYLLVHFKDNKLSFVNITSGAANRAIGNWSLYCSSKAFIKMFFTVAEVEYKQHSFFNIDPGVMDTNMQKSIRSSEFPDIKIFQSFKEDGKLKMPNDVALEILNTVL